MTAVLIPAWIQALAILCVTLIAIVWICAKYKIDSRKDDK